MEGQCGLAGLVGRGFTVEAGSDPIPAGTTIVVTDNGVLNVGLINLSRPELADLTLLGRGRVAVTLSSELGAGQSLAITWAVTVSIAYRADAVLTLPAGFEPGPGSKTSGFFQVPLLAGCFDG